MASDNRPTWPRRFPVCRFFAIVLALVCGLLLVRAGVLFMPPVERFYLQTYAVQEVFGDLPAMGTGLKSKQFPVAFLGAVPATDTLLKQGRGVLRVKLIPLDPHGFHAWLKANVYQGKTLPKLFLWPLVGSGFCLILFGACGAILDRSHNKEARDGKRLRGPEIISRWRFNRDTNGDGLRLRLTNRRNLLEWLKPGETGKDIVLRRDVEASHIEVEGGTGAGKSTVFRQFLYQIAERGETAIIFDPHLEYITEFFDSDRGDMVLNPLDNRCPYWALERETDSEAEATSTALALWPDEPNQQPFFKKHPRAIYAYLTSHHSEFNCPQDPATCESLGRWLANPRVEITPRLVGTRHAVSTDASAKDQSQGLWATLGEIATPLLMMPKKSENRPLWTAREWGRRRKGWLFLTSTPDTLDALRPLQSLWLDMLILRLQSPEKHAGQSRVWMMLDELRLLNRLPQLEMALTGQRKADCPIVVGFQNMSQLIKIYGQQDAETIVSQPFSKILLRTSDEKAAHHLSQSIGHVELERVNESMPAHWLGHLRTGRHSYNSQRVVSPLVMPSEIQSFENLTGYFVQPGKAVPIRISRQPAATRAEALIPRLVPRTDYPVADLSTAVARVEEKPGTSGNFHAISQPDIQTVSISASVFKE